MFSGFERDIPGFPRYELIGTVELGEYNLMISRVNLIDDAEYQCQVLPAGGDPALMASAHLHVLSESRPGYFNSEYICFTNSL